MSEFVISIVLSVSALLVSLVTFLYREFTGPDISLLNRPEFRLTDRSFGVSDEYIPQWFKVADVSLVFANYGRKGGTIIDVKFVFTPDETFKEFLQDFSCWPSSPDLQLPLTIKDGENVTIKFSPTIQSIDWKKSVLLKSLQDSQNTEQAVDKAIDVGKDKFERFHSFLLENKELGEVCCIVSLTVGRFRTKVEEKKFFDRVRVTVEYKETIDLLRKRLQNWGNLRPTKGGIINELLSIPKDLIAELDTDHSVLGNVIYEKNFSELRLRTEKWEYLSRARYDEIQWFLIDREKNLRDDLEKLYERMLDYNNRIQQLSYSGESHTKTDFENLNKKRIELHKSVGEVLETLKGQTRF